MEFLRIIQNQYSFYRTLVLPLTWEEDPGQGAAPAEKKTAGN